MYKIRLIEEYFKGVEVLKYTDISEESLPFILKLLKDKKKKINLEYYNNVMIKHQEIEEQENTKVETYTRQIVMLFPEEPKPKFKLLQTA